MVTYNQVANGVSSFVDNEILNKLQGMPKIALGAGTGVMLRRGENLFNALKQQPIVRMLQIVDENDNIDIDVIYEELKKQMENNSITFNVPMIGKITLTQDDVDKLYSLIVEG
mgnify:CR=1 FL=1